MSYDCSRYDDARIRAVTADLQSLILEHYPDAAFAVSEGEDPPGIYLHVTVDVEDIDKVVDVFIDRPVDLQLDEGLPVYVIPVRPLERTVAELRRAKTPAQTTPTPTTSD